MSQDEFAPLDSEAAADAGADAAADGRVGAGDGVGADAGAMPPLPQQEGPRGDADRADAALEPVVSAAEQGVPVQEVRAEDAAGQPERPERPEQASEPQGPQGGDEDGDAARGVVPDPRPLAADTQRQAPAEPQAGGADDHRGVPAQQVPPAAVMPDPALAQNRVDEDERAAVPAADGDAADGPGGEDEYHPREARLVVSRVEPWSVMKVTFLLSVALGIATVIAALLVWLVLNGMAVFSGIEKFVNSIDSTGTVATLVNYLRLPRVLALTTIVAVANIALLTALSTIGAMLYNLVASLVGGITVRLQDD